MVIYLFKFKSISIIIFVKQYIFRIQIYFIFLFKYDKMILLKENIIYKDFNISFSFFY